MPEQGTFSASYDRTTKITSVLVCVFLVVIAIATKLFAVAVLACLVIAVSYAYSPQGYEVRERSVIVKRLIGSVRMPLEDVREARAATGDDFRGCVRLWGNGGLFGYYGLFRTSKLGKCTWYVTNRSRAVVLVTAAKTAVFSPDEVEGFLAAIRAETPVPQMSSGSLAGVIEPRSSGYAWIGAAVGVVALGFVGFAYFYAPGPPTLTLSPEELAIHDRFYPVTLRAADVDVPHIRVVDLSTDTEWRPTGRTNGFANSHYRSGWFRVANGQKVRLYEAGGRRLVLLPPSGDGAAVLVEVRDPEKFVEEVQRAWSSRVKAA